MFHFATSFPTPKISPSGRRYGAHINRMDVRDFRLANAPEFQMALEGADPFPSFTQNRQFCGPTKDQGAEGSCTAHAGTSNWEFEYRKFLTQYPVFSRQFLYYKERELEGTLPNDNGAEPRTLCQVITKFGLPLESDMPYNIQNNAIAPNPAQLASALKYKSGAYHTLGSLFEVKACLRDLPKFPGHAILMGFAVYSSFEGAGVANNGLMPMPNTQQEQCLGGHETLILDYDDSVTCPGCAPGAVLVQNSWGEDWGADPGIGRRGFFWMPYAALTNLDIVWDLRVMHYGKIWVASAAA